MTRSRRPFVVLTAAVPVLLAACGGQTVTQPASSGKSPAAGAMTTRFVSPPSGTVVTGNALDAKVHVSGFRLRCAEAGKPDASGIGHYHIELDHALVNMYCTEPTGGRALTGVLSLAPH